jgi:hypothetical protein
MRINKKTNISSEYENPIFAQWNGAKIKTIPLSLALK